MELRTYQAADCKELAQLFYDTVHTVNAADYTEEQRKAWATKEMDLSSWNRSFLEHDTVVAEEEGQIVGFGDMDQDGYLDRLYVHKDHQHRGIATAICDWLEGRHPGCSYTTHASITARPFFEKRGYRVVKEQQVERRGVWLTNFVMKKSSMTVETVYDQRTMTAMAGALRKTIRKKHSRRAHRFGIAVVVLGVLLLGVNLRNGQLLTVQSGLTLLAVSAILVTLLFQDAINGFLAGKRILPGTEAAETRFYEDCYVTETKAGITEWRYDRIQVLAESKGYLIFVLGQNHAQAYDLKQISGGAKEDLIAFLEKRTGKQVVSV